jgi:hypothetical protein
MCWALTAEETKSNYLSAAADVTVDEQSSSKLDVWRLKPIALQRVSTPALIDVAVQVLTWR